MILVRMRAWPKQLFELFKLFVKDAFVWEWNGHKHLIEIGLFDKHVWQLKLRLKLKL